MLKRKLLLVRAQAERFFERLNEINTSEDSISELAALDVESHTDFELLVENLARIIFEMQLNIDFYVVHKKFVSRVVETQISWSNDYKAFKMSLREEIAEDYQNDIVDEEIFASWYD